MNRLIWEGGGWTGQGRYGDGAGATARQLEVTSAGVKEGRCVSDRGDRIGGKEMVNNIFIIKN